MGCDLPPRHVGLISRSFQFFQRVLWRPRTVPLGKHASGGQDLDDVNSIYHLCTHHMADLINSIGNPVTAFLGKHRDPRLRGVIVEIAMPPGNGDSWSASHNPRTNGETLINRVAKIDSEKRRRAHITHGREARFQSSASIAHGKEGMSKGSVLEVVNLVVAIRARRQMRVAVNQAGQHGGMREIDDARPGWNLHLGRRHYRLDPLSLNLNDHRLTYIVAGRVE